MTFVRYEHWVHDHRRLYRYGFRQHRYLDEQRAIFQSITEMFEQIINIKFIEVSDTPEQTSRACNQGSHHRPLCAQWQKGAKSESNKKPLSLSVFVRSEALFGDTFQKHSGAPGWKDGSQNQWFPAKTGVWIFAA